MKLAEVIATAWRAITKPPAPSDMRAKLMHESQLDLIAFTAASELCAAQAKAYSAKVDMLKHRIARLASEAEHA